MPRTRTRLPANLQFSGGGTSSPDDEIELTIAAESGLVLVAPGLIIQGDSSAALVVRAFAATTNVITLHGYVNRIEA